MITVETAELDEEEAFRVLKVALVEAVENIVLMRVKEGDKLIHFDAKLIKSKGYQTTCILVVTNSDDFPNMKLHTGMDAVLGETVIVEA